ncbi:diacylglycerol kinase family protein [Bowmanella dokdonensis]|uniref:Dual specificity protein phosphatase family protein n=1 Tax=Bowmanella dokdonensis TaxID=751969 RepID=A0A939IRN4_9ALTE|nr:diacylglycerol kinase family protein [Bowmanella dokdonensis]MBN7826274.1 dual specificity protein phosphatase family protein [Bowmanella dokdonensis]
MTATSAAFYYLSGAVALAILATLSSPVLVQIPLGWGGLSLFAVSLAYLANAGQIFRKRKDGRIPAYIRWIFIPFLLGVQIYNAWVRKRDTVPPVQQIEEDLYLGCRLFPTDVEYLKQEKVGAILDVTCEFDGLDWSLIGEDIAYLNIPVLDHAAPRSSQMNQALHWIHHQHKRGRKVLIHCALGRGRSVLVLAAYLLAKRGKGSATEVLEGINAIRETARLNRYQFKRLESLHKEGRLVLDKSAWIIANPIAGGGKWKNCEAEIRERLEQHFDLTFKLTSRQTNGTELGREAVDYGADLVIACGGDGTITEVAQALIDKPAVLGIIPLGTANALSHALMGPRSKLMPLSTACDTLIEGDIRIIDTANCNDKLMLLLAAIGFEHKMVHAANRKEKDMLGQGAYLLGLWEAINQNEDYFLKVQFDDEEEQIIHTQSLAIANAAPITTLLAQGRGQPDLADGKLDITWLDATEVPEQHLFSMAELVFSGLTDTALQSKVKHRRANRVRVSGDKLDKYVLDGEIFTDFPLDIQIRPASLKVLAPEP